MRDIATDNVLSRKAQAARRAIEARGMSVEKALRRALARTAEEAWNLALIAREARQAGLDQDGVADILEREDQMILLLDGPDGALGFACLDRQAVTALVEVQTLGFVTDLAPDDRPLTPTDAAMAAPLVEGALGRLADYLGDDPLAAEAAGWRFGAMIDHPRIAINLMTAALYRTFEAALDMGGGRRMGQVALVLPDRAAARPDPRSDAGPPPHEDLVLSLPARIDAVLCRLRLPYATLEALAPGALLPLPPGALDMAELVAGGRHVVTRGRLGQMNGLRAIRVSEATGAARAAAQRAAAALAGPSDADAPADEGPAFAGLGDLDVGIPWVGDADPVPDPADDAAEGEAFELPPLDFDLALDGDGGQSFDFALDLPGAASSGDD